MSARVKCFRLAVILAMLLSGCATSTLSGVGQPVFGANGTDACAVLSKAEVAKALGEQLDEPIGEQEMGSYGCTYTPLAASNNSVAIELSPGSAFPQRKRYFVAQGGRPVSGFGDEALAKGGAILVLQRNTIVYLVLLHDGWDEQRCFAAARTLILDALARVP